VAVHFNSLIDPARSRLSLVPADGRPGAPAAAPLVLEILPPADRTVLEAAVPPLAPGPWRLRWQVLAVDGHITRGDIPFTIGPAAAR
jgi:methionine-rich copper-binding protein CopC